MQQQVMTTHILSIHCADESGLVYKIKGVVFRHNLNIIRNDEFVEKDFNQFFMRTEFSGDFETNDIRATCSIISNGEALWNDSYTRESDYNFTANEIIEHITDNFAKHFPYKRKA